MHWLIPAGLSAIGTIVNTNSAKQQNSQRLAINQYNAQAQYNVNMSNINSQYMLGSLNASLSMAAAGMQNRLADLQMQSGLNQAEIIRTVAGLNIRTIGQTTTYNNQLLDEELSLMWEAMDLDLLHLSNQRAVERGSIEARQAASGTVMGEGSNADVIVSQKTQEALDELVVRHNADISANKIRNAQAKNSYEGRMQMLKTSWEGQMGALVALENARMQSFSTRAGAASTALQGIASLASANIAKKAGTYSAQQQLQSGMYGAEMDYSMNNAKIKSDFVTGMFGAASAGVGAYYMQKQPTVNWQSLFQNSNPATAPATSTVMSTPLSVAPTNYKFASGYERGFSLTEEGSSLFGN